MALSSVGVASLFLLLFPVAFAANCQHYSFTLGGINATVLSDGFATGNVTDILIDIESERFESALSQNFLPKDIVSFYYNPLHLDYGDRKVLIDVGSGDKLGPQLGKLMQNMASAGLDPLEVTDVLTTHAHVDHLGGFLLPDGSLAFPNAKYHISRVEHDFWMNAKATEITGRIQPELVQLLVDVAQLSLGAVQDRLVLFELGDEVLPGITSRGAGGHTPGQVNYIIKSGDQTLVHAADVLVWDVFSIQHPDWEISFDMDGTTGVDARFALLEELAQSGTLFLSYHNDFPGLGHITREGEGYGLKLVKYQY